MTSVGQSNRDHIEMSASLSVLMTLSVSMITLPSCRLPASGGAQLCQPRSWGSARAALSGLESGPATACVVAAGAERLRVAACCGMS